eukprot:5581999-Amphidinium_carterae.1
MEDVFVMLHHEVKHENADSEEAHGDDTLAKADSVKQITPEQIDFHQVVDGICVNEETAEGIIVIFVNAPGMALQAHHREQTESWKGCPEREGVEQALEAVHFPQT